MIKRLIRIIILILVPFWFGLTGALLLLPGVKPDQLEPINELLKEAENRFRENGEFRKRLWLNSDSWSFQTRLTHQPLKIQVPSCWNSLPGLENYSGKALYSLEFLLPENFGPRVFLCFRGVSYQARVKLNSFYLGEHKGAYTPFEFEVSDLMVPVLPGKGEGENFLEVEVDNQLSMKTLPGKYQGWKHIGGIYREVYLESRSEVFIKEVKLIAEPVPKGGLLKIELSLDNSLGKTGEFLISGILKRRGAEILLEKALRVSGEKEPRVNLEQEISGVKPWEPEKPRLYPLVISLKELPESSLEKARVIDQVSYQIGFRKIEARGEELYLNGKPLKIKGVSRHNFYPRYFQTIPAEVLSADLEKIKELGANLVRLGHYPNHPYLLELCDQLGLLVWEEIPAFGRFSPDYRDPEVIEAGKAQLWEMIQRDRNHPSLVIIGLGNQIPSDKKSGENFIKELAEFAKPRLSGQLLAIASDQFEKERSAPYLDLIGFNCYLGWYGGKVEQMEALLKKLKAQFRQKPILLSEYGADAQIRKHGASGDIYSEENQALFLKKVFKIIEAEGIGGGILWLLADYPDPTRPFNPNPFMNQKGLLTEDRRTKLGFAMMGSLYQGLSFQLQARSRLGPRIRDSALAGLSLILIFFGLLSRIPEKWLLLMPGLTQPQKLLRRAFFVIALQALIYELIWQSLLAHQPFLLPLSLPYPGVKLIQIVFNSRFRPIFIFLFLFWLWWLMSEFFSLLLEKKLSVISRHPFELTLGLGDPLSWAFPYPLLAVFPELMGLALNLPSLLISGKLFNQFTTIPWLFFQFSYPLLILISLIKLPLILRAGFKISFFRALFFLILFFLFANLLLGIQFLFLLIL